MFESISGHKKQIEFLSKALETGKLAHRLLKASQRLIESLEWAKKGGKE